MKRLIIKIITILLILLIVFSIYKIGDKFYDYHKAGDIYSDIKDSYKPLDNDKNEYKSFSDINSDYRFWISVENTNIDYPVVQGKDNSFYLNKDVYKEVLSSGSIFLDYRNDYTSDDNIIIYGHNMKNKTMFSALENFKDKNFFNENNKIIIQDYDNKYIYEVFSAYFVDANFDYLDVNFNDKDDFEEYINTVSSKSLTNSNIDVTSNDKIITLSTCSYEGSDTRTIVHGKLIEVVPN